MNNVNENKTNPLAVEPIGRLLFKLALPAIIGQIVNLLYNIVDRMFIGNIPEIGTKALTGVGITFSIITLISAFASLIGLGGAPRASIKMGQNDYRGAEKILGNCFVSLITISIVLTIIFLIFHERLLLMFGASDETLIYGKEYIQIYICGTIFVQLALGLNSFISCQGFAKTSMQTILIGAILNIILDFLFIRGWDMGVKGAAYATVISQSVSAIWVILFLTKSKRTKIKIRVENFKIKKEVLLPVLALGISPFIMQSTESLLNIAFNSSLRNYGGDIAVGSMTILATIMQCANLPAMGIGQGAQPIISFNYGLGNEERVRKAFKLLIVSSITFTVLVWAVITINPEPFIGLFLLDKNDPMMEYAKSCLRIYMLALFILGIQFSCQQAFVALGQAKISLFLALLRKIVLLIPLIYIFPNLLPDSFLTWLQQLLGINVENKVFAVFLAEPVSDVIAAITTAVMFMIVSKKILKNLENKQTIEKKIY